MLKRRTTIHGFQLGLVGPRFTPGRQSAAPAGAIAMPDVRARARDTAPTDRPTSLGRLLALLRLARLALGLLLRRVVDDFEQVAGGDVESAAGRKSLYDSGLR